MDSKILMLLPITLVLILQPYAALGLNIRNIPLLNKKNQGKSPPNPLIEKACATAKNKNSCTQTLKSLPGSETADLKNLAFLALNSTKDLGSQISALVASKLDDEDNDEDSMGPGIEQALNDCNDQYTDAMAQLEDSLVAFFSKAYNDVNTYMTTAMKNAQTCEEGLQKGNAIAILGNKNKVFAQRCADALEAVNVLAQQR